MEIQALTIDGTDIEADRIQVGRNGITLEKRQQSGQSIQSGSTRSGQSHQSNESEESHEQSEEITIVFDEDVPPDEREELIDRTRRGRERRALGTAGTVEHPIEGT